MSGKLLKSKGDDVEDEELLDFRELDQLALMHQNSWQFELDNNLLEEDFEDDLDLMEDAADLEDFDDPFLSSRQQILDEILGETEERKWEATVSLSDKKEETKKMLKDFFLSQEDSTKIKGSDSDHFGTTTLSADMVRNFAIKFSEL